MSWETSLQQQIRLLTLKLRNDYEAGASSGLGDVCGVLDHCICILNVWSLLSAFHCKFWTCEIFNDDNIG